jgi:tol-pal system protein YbgF
MRQILFAALLFALTGVLPARAQMSASDAVIRLEQIENQMRQLTGQVEQLQFRNQQLEQQLRKMQEDNEFRFQELSGKGGARPAAQVQQPMPQQPAAPRGGPAMNDPTPVRPVAPGRRSDVFDPNENPNAPGAPRALGSLPAGQPSAQQAPIMADEPVGARGGRDPGAPLDLGTLAGNAAAMPPVQRNEPPQSAMASVAPPSQTPRDQFDLGRGYMERKDYALAESSFREFMRRYPNDRLAPDAQYWLGESLFQRQRYRDAADAFLGVSTKYDTAAKAPEALLRLGQSLATMGEKETACATFAEIGRKYPRAGLNVKHGVEREQKRVRC